MGRFSVIPSPLLPRLYWGTPIQDILGQYRKQQKLLKRQTFALLYRYDNCVDNIEEIFVIFRLVAIATYFILTYSMVNSPVILKKPLFLNLVEMPKSPSETNNENILLTDGIYLFGQSPQPEQIQNEYFVFKLQSGKVIGAFYLPHSSFYCFYGIYQQNRLEVKVVDSYDNTASDYTVNLEKYHRINQISDNDTRILNYCQTNYKH